MKMQVSYGECILIYCVVLIHTYYLCSFTHEVAIFLNNWICYSGGWNDSSFLGGYSGYKRK